MKSPCWHFPRGESNHRNAHAQFSVHAKARKGLLAGFWLERNGAERLSGPVVGQSASFGSSPVASVMAAQRSTWRS